MFDVAEIMTTELFTLNSEASLQDARILMAEHNIRHLPVVDENLHLVGLVSQRDILAASDSSLLVPPGSDDGVERYVAVSSVMTTNVHTVDENASLRGVALYMQEHKIGCVPVLSGKSLAGIVTDSDFVAVAINLMELLEEREPEETDLEENEIF